jgi:hypothetical protein
VGREVEHLVVQLELTVRKRAREGFHARAEPVREREPLALVDEEPAAAIPASVATPAMQNRSLPALVTSPV